MSTDIKHYSMIIQWDERDNIYVVRVPELPGCLTHGKTYEEALQQGQDAIESWITVAKELGRPIPPPEQSCSMRVMAHLKGCATGFLQS